MSYQRIRVYGHVLELLSEASTKVLGVELAYLAELSGPRNIHRLLARGKRSATS